MGRRHGLDAVVGAVAATVLAAPVAMAGTAATWTVMPSGPIVGTGGDMFVVDSWGNKFRCVDAGVAGDTAPSPVTGSSAQLAVLTSASFPTTCTGPFSSTLALTGITEAPNGHWVVVGTDHTAGAGTHGTGSTAGFIDHIRIAAQGHSILGPCAFDLTGSLDVVYDNPGPGDDDGVLVMAPAEPSRQLVLGNKSGGGCGFFGASATIQGAYGVVSGIGGSPVVTRE